MGTISVRKFLSVREIEELLEKDELWPEIDQKTIDIVELPPDKVDEVSDCEDFDDDILEDTLQRMYLDT